MNAPAVIAAYFGSGDTASMDLLDAALARAFPGSPVYRAFLRSGFRPSVPEVLAEVLPAGYWLAAMNGQPSLTELLPRLAGTRLYLAPFLLTAGYHVSKDLAAWREHLTTRGCTVEVLPRPLAQCPAIQTIITAHGAMGMGGRKPCD